MIISIFTNLFWSKWKVYKENVPLVFNDGANMSYKGTCKIVHRKNKLTKKIQIKTIVK